MVQDENRTYGLTQDQIDLVEKYLDGLVEKDRAIQPREGDPLYYIFPSVHRGSILVDVDYEEGILAMAGESFSLGNLVAYIEGARLGRLRLKSVLKFEKAQSQ